MSDVAISTLRRWRQDPVAFVRECFRIEPDAWQVELLRALPTQKRMAAAACKGPGKTACMAWMGWNFLLTRPKAKIPCTSITGPNLADGLWAEFAKWQGRSPILEREFQWTKTRIFHKRHPADWFASARAWAQDADPSQQANTLAGIHADYLLFLIDEVSNIPDGVVSAAEGALTSGIETKLFMAGNCTKNSGPLYRAVVTDRHRYHVTRITGDPDDPNRSPRIDIEEARATIKQYGRESYIVKVNILGEFPERQADKLIDVKDCEAAMRRSVSEREFQDEAKIIGLDVARFGDDASDLAFRQGKVAFPSKEMRGLDTMELADQLLFTIDRWEPDAAFVDATGIGAGVVDRCKQRGYGHLVQEVHFGMKARDDEKYENKRAEMYDETAQWLRNGGCLPQSPMLAEELSAPVFFYDKRNRICLEPKKDIKARIGRSPDKADGLVLTFAFPTRPRNRGGRLPYNPHGDTRAKTKSSALEGST